MTSSDQPSPPQIAEDNGRILRPSQPGAADHLAGLLSHHLADLRKSGLRDEIIKAAELRSAADYNELAVILNWRKYRKGMGPAIVFPYRAADGSTGYRRIKPDRPRKLGNKIVKYESPRGRPNEIYLPPGMTNVLTCSKVELLITEGEKKALAATQAGFNCIGLVGVFGWKDGRNARLLPSLERVNWHQRTVFIVFDSDIAINADVAEAARRLAAELKKLGAVVRVVYLPASEDGLKVGLDDYLVVHGAAKLQMLINSAEEAEPLGPLEAKCSAKELEPCQEIQGFLANSEVDGLPTVRYWRGSYIRWVRGAYREQPTSELKAAVVRYLNQRAVHVTTQVRANHMMQLEAQSILSSRTEPPIWIDKRIATWPESEVLAAPNGLFHLPSLIRGAEFRHEPTPRFFTLSALDFDFNLNAPRPAKWLEFLGELWPDDQESIDTLQEVFGYLLVSDTRQQKMFMLLGPKRSGKGTIARVIRGLVGAENVAGPTLASFATNFGLWPLLGRSVAIISDARLSGRTDSAVVVERLLSVSGEDALTIDRKMLEPVTCKLPTRIVILTNELPRLGDSSGAIVSRLILLHLTESFYGREDPELTDRLLVELPGILIWAIAGWQRLFERGYFVQPSSGHELLIEMGELSSPISTFLRDRCRIGPDFEVRRHELYTDYVEWCEQQGQRKPDDDSVFGRNLRAALPSLRGSSKREFGERVRYYVGVGFP